MLEVLHAATLAAAAHAGQRRRGLEEPYINHPLRVADHAARAGLDIDAVVAALLHDVVEDGAHTWDQLRAEGFNPRALDLARRLTKWWQTTDEGLEASSNKAAYYAAILEDPVATSLKLLDRTDNLQDTARIADSRREFSEKYLRKTHREFPLLLDACDNVYVRRVFGEQYAALETALGRMPSHAWC